MSKGQSLREPWSKSVTMSAEVFVSYARTDRERVMELVERMRSAGIGVWVDEGGIHGASLWGQEIVDAIDASKVMILMISDSSITSDNVVKELSIASEDKKPILPVYLHRSEIPKSMRYQLAGIQHIEFFEGQEGEAFQSMLVSLSRLGVSAEGAEAKPGSTSETVLEGQSTATNAPVSTGRKSSLVTPLLVLAVIGLVLALVLRPDKSPETSGDQTAPVEKSEPIQAKQNKTSITVLPFRNIGPSNNESFLADGMHEEIDAMLSMTPSLTVKNASRMKGMALDPRSVGEDLKVDSVLTGTVRQSAGQLRVTVKLIDTKTEEIIWASTFDKSESDIFSVQREIAQSVAEGLSVNLDGEFESLIYKSQTKNLEAYNLYLEARLLWNTRNKDKMYQAIEKYELALVKDPQFALGHVGIAECYNMIGGYGFSPPSIAYPKAKRALEQALKINENISEAHSSLGWNYYAYEYDFDNAEKSLLKALSLSPSSPEANRWYAQVRSIRFKPESLDEIKKAIKLEPHSAITRMVQVRILTAFNKLDEAMDSAIKVQELDSQYIMWPYAKIEVLYLQGKYEEALSLSEEAIKSFDDPMYFGAKGFLLGQLNRKEEAISVIDTLEKISSERSIRNQYIFMIYYSIGDYEKALNMLNTSIQKKQYNAFVFDPRIFWDKLHDNDKFKKIFLDLGLPLKPW